MNRCRENRIHMPNVKLIIAGTGESGYLADMREPDHIGGMNKIRGIRQIDPNAETSGQSDSLNSLCILKRNEEPGSGMVIAVLTSAVRPISFS